MVGEFSTRYPPTSIGLPGALDAVNLGPRRHASAKRGEKIDQFASPRFAEASDHPAASASFTPVSSIWIATVTSTMPISRSTAIRAFCPR